MTMVDENNVDNDFSIHKDNSNLDCDTIIFYLHCSNEI